MAQGRQPSQSLPQEAERIAREQSALLVDLSARLFPRSQLALDDATVASARAILFTLVGQIERAMTGEDAGESWPIIERSRLCTSSDILAFLMAHAAFLRVSQRITPADMRRSNAWLATFGANDETLAGRSAMELLSARSRPAADRLSGRYDLPALLYRMVAQQVAAALQSQGRQKREVVPVSDILAAHDEAKGLPHIATRLALQLAAEGAFGQLRDPRQAGMDLFAGSLAAELDCTWHEVVRILAEGGPRLVVLLRAAEFRRDEAEPLLQLLEAHPSTDALSQYDGLSKDAARRILTLRSSPPTEISNDA